MKLEVTAPLRPACRPSQVQGPFSDLPGVRILNPVESYPGSAFALPKYVKKRIVCQDRRHPGVQFTADGDRHDRQSFIPYLWNLGFKCQCAKLLPRP